MEGGGGINASKREGEWEGGMVYKKKKKLNPAVIVAVRGPGRTTAQTKKKAAKKFPKRLNRNRKSRKM